MKNNKKTSDSEKMINAILKDQNTKAMTHLERILKRKIAKRINSVLNK